MGSIQLLTSTGNERADAIIRGVVGIFEAVFPYRVRGYYLTGSYSSGSAAPSSDLDLGILFRGTYREDAESDQAIELCQHCEALNPLLDLGVLSEERIQHPDMVGTVLQLKATGRLLFGEDSRAEIEAACDERYVRWAMHTPFHGIAFARPHESLLRVPLRFPDPDGEFFGYDQWKTLTPEGGESTKLLEVIVGWIATALVVYRTGNYVGSKQETATLYRDRINDEWTELVEQVHELCQNRWGYHLPTSGAERQELRALCRRALEFENHFLSIYQGYLLQELGRPDRESQARAVERLGQFIYPGLTAVTALQALDCQDDPALQQAVADAIQRNRAAASPA